MKKKYIKLIGNILTVIAFILIVKRLYEMDVDYSVLLSRSNVWWLTLFCVLYGIHIMALPVSWQQTIQIITRSKVPFSSVEKVFCKSNILKYIPGNVFQYVGRNEIAVQFGFSHKAILMTTLLDVVANILGVTIVSLTCYARGIRIGLDSIGMKINPLLVIVIAVAFLFFLCLLYWKRKIISEKMQDFCTLANVKRYLFCIVYYMFFAVYTGIVYLLVLTQILDMSIANDKIYIVIGAYLLSWLLGFIMPGAPGGIGIRETVIIVLLATYLPSDSVLLAIVIYRIVSMIGDFFAFIMSFLIDCLIKKVKKILDWRYYYVEFCLARKKVFSKNNYPLILFGCSFIGNILLSLFMRYPIITDEYNTLAEGVFLSGNETVAETFRTLANTGYYGWGYVILFSWIYHLTHDMLTVYHAALVCNSFFVALIPFLAYKIAVRHFKLEDKKAFGVSFCLCLYPAYILYSKYTMNESILQFIIWPLLFLLLEFINASPLKRGCSCLLMGFLSMYSYAIHGRGLAILCMATVILIILILFVKDAVKRKVVYGVLYAIPLLAVYIINSYVKDDIALHFAGTEAGQMANTTENLLSAAFFQSLIGDHSIRIIYGFLGQSFYIVVTTLGMSVSALIAYVVTVFRGFKEKSINSVAVLGTFAIGLMTSTLVISVLFFSNLYISEAMRGGEYYVYGRYNELAGGMVIFFLLIYYAKMGFSQIMIRCNFVLYILLMAGGMLVAVKKLLKSFNPKLSYTMVIGMIPFSGRNLYLDPTVLSYIKLILVVTVIYILVLFFLYKRSDKMLCILISGIFLYSVTFSLIEFIYPTSREKSEEVQALEEFNDILIDSLGEEVKGIYILDSTVPKPRMLFAFSDYPVKHMENIEHNYSNFEQIPEGSIFISTKEEYLDKIFDEIYYIQAIKGYYVWGYGEKLENSLNELGVYCTRRKSPIFLYDGKYLSLKNQNPDEKVEVKNKSQSLTIPKNHLQYGPYCILHKGKYRVDIYGKNLEKGINYAWYNYGLLKLEIDKVMQSSEHVQYYVDLPEFSDSVEFLCENTTETFIVVDSITITPVETKTVSIRNASDVPIQERHYDVSDGYRNFKAYINSDENCIVSWRYIRLNPMGNMVINSLPMTAGENQLTLSGSNIALSNIKILSDDGRQLEMEYVEQESLNRVILYVDCPEIINIEIENTSESYIDFSDLEVRLCGR
jgi:hypothetical protein